MSEKVGRNHMIATINLTFQSQEVGMLAKQWAQWACVFFNKVEDVWQLKWPLVTHLASNWQLTNLGCA